MHLSDLFPQKFVESLVFEEVASVVVILEFVNSLVEKSSLKGLLIFKHPNDALHFLPLFLLEPGLPISPESGYDFTQNSLFLLVSFDIADRCQDMAPAQVSQL